MIYTPYESLGNIKFGECRDSVRRTLPNYKEFKKNRFSKNTTDDYTEFHIFYNVENKVEAIEVFHNIEIDYKGINIANATVTELVAMLKDSKQSKEEDSINFPTYGLTIAIDKDKIESILFYNKGYWD